MPLVGCYTKRTPTPPLKFFNTHDLEDLRAHTMSCPGDTPSLPQKFYHPSFSKQPLIHFIPRGAPSILQPVRGSRNGGCGIIHSQRDKRPLTTGELLKLIHFFHSLGLPADIQGGAYGVLCHRLSLAFHIAEL